MSQRRARWARVGLWAASLTLGCSSLRSGANPDGPNWKHRPSWSMHVTFERDLVAPARIVGEPYQRGQPEVDATNMRLFVGSSDNGLYALRARNGDTLWRFETLGFVQCAPLYDPGDNVVYFGSNDGALYRVDADTGALAWRFMTNAEVARRPVLSDGILYAANANDTLIAVDAKTGKLLWTQHRTPALGMEIAGYSGPALSGSRVFMGFSDGSVTAFDKKTGEERWQPLDLSAEAEQMLGEVPQYLDVDTTPIPATLESGPAVFVASYEGGVFALDADAGTHLWSNTDALTAYDLTLWEEPERRDGDRRVPAQRLLLVSTGTTGLWALDTSTGEELWRAPLPTGGVSAPVPILGALMVTTTELGIFLLSPRDGSLIDGIHLAHGSSSTPAVHGTRAFVLSDSGRLFGLQVTPPVLEPADRGLPPI
jgi:outer membrane protein assembly factor BamB